MAVTHLYTIELLHSSLRLRQATFQYAFFLQVQFLIYLIPLHDKLMYIANILI